MTTLLCVDDDPTTVDLIKFMLEPHGYRVVSASSVEDALTLHENLDPDVMLLDLFLPNRQADAWDGVRTIASQPRWAEVPAIIISAASPNAYGWQALDERFAAFIPKPFKPRQLLTTIEHSLAAEPLH